MTTFTSINSGNYRLKALELPSGVFAYVSPDQSLRNLGYPFGFSVETLCAAIQNGCTIDNINWYLQSYEDTSGLKNTLVRDGWPALYYAAERNSPELVSILLQHGLDPSITHNDFPIPLLAFVIIHGYREARDTTTVAKILLAFGVDPTVIPKDMWIEFLEAPNGSSGNSSGEIKTRWCTPKIRPLLAKALHLTHRYLLRLAHKMGKPKARELQMAKANNMSNLLKLPYFLIGQIPAAKMVMNTVFGAIAVGQTNPLVVAFAGPSGHGKTEIARAMGDLLSVKTTIIDCATLSTVTGFFGPTFGYVDCEKGTQLNNFLAENSGQRSIVFLDEFDKTQQEVRNALLLITETGAYSDRRTNTKLDCSKTVWVLATNLGDDSISRYYTRNLERLSDEELDNFNMTELENQVKNVYKNRFGAPFTGRIRTVVPFLPFSPQERAVLLHKFILDLSMRIREPIDLSPRVSRLIGHCRLTLIDDGKVCVELTNQHYNMDLGARSLKSAAEKVEFQFITEYKDSEEEVAESTNSLPLQEYIVRRVPVGDGAYTIGVFHGASGSSADLEDNDVDGDSRTEDCGEKDDAQNDARKEKPVPKRRGGLRSSKHSMPE